MSTSASQMYVRFCAIVNEFPSRRQPFTEAEVMDLVRFRLERLEREQRDLRAFVRTYGGLRNA
jgi:hypothetical protein